MNITETSKLLALLNREYPREIVDRDRTELWQEALANSDYKEIRAALTKWLADPDQSQWMPKPGQLKALCVRSSRHARLDEDPAMVDRYFKLTAKYQIEPLDESEARELERIESSLGIPSSSRCLVRFNQPVREVAR